MADENVDQGNTETTESSQETSADTTLLGGNPESTDESTESTEEVTQDEDASEGDGDDDVSEGAPENYEEFELPEGFNMDTGLLDAITPTLKELNLSQVQAQKLVAAYASNMQAQSDSYQAEVSDTLTKNLNEVKSDKTLGGDNLVQTEANIATALKAYETHAGSENAESFKQLMNEPVLIGVGNNVHLVRMLNWVGSQMAEDSGLRGDSSAPARARHDILYGETTKS